METVSLVLPKTTRGELDHPFPPLGILYLGASLKKNGYDVEVVDGNILDEESYNVALENLRGDLIGVSTTFFHMKEVKRILPKLKSNSKPIAIGGPGASSILDKEGLLRETGIDFVLEGEAEKNIVSLLRGIESDSMLDLMPGLSRLVNGDYRKTHGLSRVYVDENPIPDRSLIDMSDYLKWGNYTGMIISRGCPYLCIYCDLTVAGKKARYRSIVNVMDEMKMIQDLNIKDVFIFDDNFTVNRQYLRQFRDEKKHSDISLTWGGNARVNYVNDEFCEIVTDSNGTRLFFGVESGSQKMLNIYNKRTTPEQVITAFDKCWEHGIEPKGYVMVGHPQETWDDIQKTADLVARIKPAYLDISILTPIPGTILFDQTCDSIDLNKFSELDTRQEITVYKDLKFDVQDAIKLIKSAYHSSIK